MCRFRRELFLKYKHYEKHVIHNNILNWVSWQIKNMCGSCKISQLELMNAAVALQCIL